MLNALLDEEGTGAQTRCLGRELRRRGLVLTFDGGGLRCVPFRAGLSDPGALLLPLEVEGGGVEHR
ncbi:MAG: hypothetical protein RhofKO_32020 [Rhodothermales bacterium]